MTIEQTVSGADADAAFKRLVEKKQSARRESAAAATGIEVKTLVAEDGRVSSTVDARGLVQLNVRVPVEIKNAVLAERLRRKAQRLAASDVGDIVAEALSKFLAELPMDA